MMAGGIRRCRRGVLAGLGAFSLTLLSATPAMVRPVSADTCLLTLCLPQATPAPPTPAPAGSGSLLGIQLPPCLICVSPPLPVSLCGVTKDCRPAPDPAVIPRAPAPSARVPSAGPPASAFPPAPQAVSNAAVVPTAGTTAAGGSAGPAEAGLHIQAPSLAQLSPVSGLSFGGALRLWPVLIFLDAAALVALIAVLRRTWSPAPAP